MENKQLQLAIYNLLKEIYKYCKKTNQAAGQIASYYYKPPTIGLDSYQFNKMIQTIIPQSNPQLINELFKFIIRKYNSQAIQSQHLDQLMLNLEKQLLQEHSESNLVQDQNKMKQPQQQQRPQQQHPQQQQQQQYRQQTPEKVQAKPQRQRTSTELIDIFSAKLTLHQISIQELFKKYDRNHDNQMDQNEFQEMFKIVIKDCSKEEISLLIQDLFKSSQQLTLFQLIKLGREHQNPAIDPTKAIMESNFYENPQNAKLLSSNIQFQEIYVMDQNIPAMKEFIQRFEQLKKNNQIYQDPTFPPNQQSLGPKFTKYQWKRPSQFIRGNVNFFVKDQEANRFGIGKWITPNDLCQGALGDCYFLASISALGNRRPDLMLEIFVTRTVNQQGIYCVKFCIDGGWKAIAIDDYFPTLYDKLAFTRGKNNELWVIVVEKAWAKVFGSYENIEAGYPREVLRTLTGAPTQTLFTNTEDFIVKLENCIKERCIMVCATQKKEQMKQYGLIPGHAYTLLKIKIIEHPQKGKVKLLKIRNPWGKEEWQGDWSDGSKLWTPQLKEELKIKQQDDGIFYMELGQFMQFFDDVQACYVKDHYKYSFLYVQSDRKHSQYFEIQITTPGIYYFSVCQKNKRFENGKEYSLSRILIVDKHFIEVCSTQNKDGEVWCKANIGTGTFLAQIKTPWEYSKQDQFNFSVYGPNVAQIKQISKLKNMVQQMLMQRARQFQKLKAYPSNPQILKGYEFDHKNGFGFYYVVNKSAQKLESKVTMNQMGGLKLMKPLRGNQLNIILNPNEEYLALFGVAQTGYKFAMEESYVG